MKLHSMEELLDRDLGPVGTEERDKFENEVANEVQAYKVGEAIKRARLAKKLTQKQLGERIGVQRSQISRLEKGKSITFASLMRVFHALGVSASLNMKGIGSVVLC